MSTISHSHLYRILSLLTLCAPIPAQGVPTLVKTFGGPGNDYPHDVHVTSSGDILITGEFSDSMSVGGQTKVSMGGTDMLLISLDSAGTVKWSQRGGGKYNDRGTLILNETGTSIQVAGTCFGQVKFGVHVNLPGYPGEYNTPVPNPPGELRLIHAREAEETQFLATYKLSIGKLAADPVFDQTLFQDTRLAMLSSTDPSDMVIAGTFFLRKNMDSSLILSSEGEEDALVAKYAANGALAWAVSGGGPKNDRGVAVALGPGPTPTYVIVVGAYQGTATFHQYNSQNTITTPASNGGTDIFVIKYSL